MKLDLFRGWTKHDGFVTTCECGNQFPMAWAGPDPDGCEGCRDKCAECACRCSRCSFDPALEAMADAEMDATIMEVDL